MSALWIPRLEEAALWLGGGEDGWAWLLRGLTSPVRRAVLEEWAWQAHGGQRESAGDWRT